MRLLRFLSVPTLLGSSLLVFGACGSSDDTAGSSPSPDASPVTTIDSGGADSSSTEDSGDGAVPVASVAALDVCSASAKSLCAFFQTCAPEALTALWASASECEPRFRENCIAGYPINAEVRKDDADAYVSCHGKLACDDLYGPRWSMGCVVPRLKTTKPLGAACRKDFECESNACTGSSTQCGTCVTRKKAGEACTDADECPVGGYCYKKCYAPVFLGDSCDEYRICGNGLGCTGGKCVKIGKVGEPCDGDIDCDLAKMVQCNKTTKKCEQTTWVDPGASCPKAFDDGPPISCGKGSSCIRPASDTTGTCVANVKVGQACGDSARCEAFINCRDGKCVLPTWVACP
jgi:hypothetical protein